MSRNRSYTPNPTRLPPPLNRGQRARQWLFWLRPARRSNSRHYYDNRPSSYSGYPSLNGYQDNRGQSRLPRPNSYGGAPQYPPPPLQYYDPRDSGYGVMPTQPPMPDGIFGPAAPQLQGYYPLPTRQSPQAPPPHQNNTTSGRVPNDPQRIQYGDGSYGPAIPPPGPPPNWQGQHRRDSRSRSPPGDRPPSRNSEYGILNNRGSPAPPPGTGFVPPPPGPSSTWNGLNRPGFVPYGSEDDFVMPSGPNGQHRNGHKTHYMSGGAGGWPDQPIQPVVERERGRRGYPESRSITPSHASHRPRHHRDNARYERTGNPTRDRHGRNRQSPSHSSSSSGFASGTINSSREAKYERFRDEIVEDQRTRWNREGDSNENRLPSDRIRQDELPSFRRFKEKYHKRLTEEARDERKGRSADRQYYDKPSQESSDSSKSSRSESYHHHRHGRHRDKERRHGHRRENGDHRGHHKHEHRKDDKHRHGRHRDYDRRDSRDGDHHRDRRRDRHHHRKRDETPSDVAPKPKKRHHRQYREEEDYYYEDERPSRKHRSDHGRHEQRERRRARSRYGDFAVNDNGTGRHFGKFAVGIIPVTLEAGTKYAKACSKFWYDAVRSV